MAEITLRVPLGRPLTYQEVDDNFRSVQELTLLAQQFALSAQEASTLADEAKNEAIAAKDEALTASGSAASDAQRAEAAADRAEVSKNAAQSSASLAQSSASSASSSAADALSSKSAAESAEVSAGASAVSAANDADRAESEAERVVSLASIDPGVGKIPLAGASGTIKQAWVNNLEFELDALDAKLDALDSLTVNRGKNYPLRPAVRGGVETDGHPAWDGLLLNVVVDGATPGEIYRIGYQQNGALLDGVEEYDWIIYVSDEEEYASSGSQSILIGYQDDRYGPQQQIDPAGGVQTVVLYPPSRPWMAIYITVDADRLPINNNVILSTEIGHLGGSWIIDPSCYRYSKGISENGYWLSNQGMKAPLKPLARGGVVSSGSDFLLNAILDVAVVGARPGYYYGIRYFKNGVPVAGNIQDGWAIEEVPIDEFEDSMFDIAGQNVVNIRDYAPDIDRSLGVQTIRVDAPGRELSFYITLDPKWFPVFGTPARAEISSRPGYSWVIDPARYFHESDQEQGDPSESVSNSIEMNRGHVAPFRAIERGGKVSESSDFLLNAILDVQVIGAKEGYFYGLKYFKNGTTALAGPQDGWQIEEVMAEEYADSGFTVGNRVVDFQDPAPDIDRSIGIQTVRIEAPGRDLVFYITLDPQYFPEFGTHVGMNTASRPGFSWIIDPARYFHEPVNEQESSSETRSLTYSVDESGLCLISWKSGDRYLRWRFGPNGANDLPNFSGIYESLDGVSYSAVSTFGTDWLPPLIFDVDSEPEFTDGMGFTGGNHLLVEGRRTARNIAYKLYADGAPVNTGSSGACQKLTAIVVNEVMAANTVSLERYAARQSFAVSFSPGVAEVSCEFRALEDLRVKNDYGPQLVSTGFNDTQLILDGQYAGRIDFSGDNNSGPFSNYPNAWAVIMQSDNHGQLASWLDHSYGVGDGEHVAPSEPRIRGGGNSTKQYHAAIRNMTTPLQMAAGDTYRWRGGYALSAPVEVGEGFDSVMSFAQDGAPRHAMIVDASDYVVLP